MVETSFKATGLSPCTADHDGVVMETLLSISPEEIGVEEMKKCLKAAELLLVREKEATNKLEALLGAKYMEVQEYEQSCASTIKAGEASGTSEGDDRKADAKVKDLSSSLAKTEKSMKG